MRPTPKLTQTTLAAVLLALTDSAVAQDAAPSVFSADAGPNVEIGGRGLTVTSADGRYAVTLRGWAQLSGRFYVADDEDLGTNEQIGRAHV